MRPLIIFAFLLLSNFSIGQQTLNKSITHDNIQRDYILYVPASYNANNPVPLVLCFHGYTSNATLNYQYTNFKAIADTAGFILIHPQGTLLNGNTHWNVGGWTIGSTVDDVGFTNALIDSVSSSYAIDPNKIYSTGMSNGGYMSFLLACQLSNRIAAVASVTGSMTVQTFNNCNPQHPTPVLQIHGTMDATVPYNGNPTWTKSIEDVIQYWVNYNNCDPNPTTINIANSNLLDNSTVDQFIYSNGDNDVNTEHFKVYGGGHDWPGVWGNLDMDASIEIWKFFLRYDINGLITNLEDHAVNEVTLYPNPTSDVLHIELNSKENSYYTISDDLGRIVESGTVINSSKTIHLSSKKPGLYLLKIQNKVYRIIKT